MTTQVGGAGVANQANTSLGEATGVVALGGIGGTGVVEGGVTSEPDYIATESDVLIDTESNENLVTE